MHGVVSFNMGNNLFAQREKSILVGFLVFMDMDRGYFKSVITFGFDLFVGSALVILPDVYHQHMQVKQLFPGASLVEGVGGTTHAGSLSGVACVDNTIANYLDTGVVPARSGAGADLRCPRVPPPTP